MALSRDLNHVPIQGDGLTVSKTMVFAGATADDPGEYDGNGNPATLFTVTGTVVARIIAICDVSLTGANATVAVGITGATTTLITTTTGTNIDEDEIWHDASPDASLEAYTVSAERILNGTDIIQTVATADVTAGQITYYCIWKPVSVGATVVPA